VGFATPVVLAALAAWVPYPVLLLGLAGLAVLTLPPVAVGHRREPAVTPR
jgi:hypothetical protein